MSLRNIRARLDRLAKRAGNKPHPINWDALAAGDWPTFTASLPDALPDDANDPARDYGDPFAEVLRLARNPTPTQEN